MQLKTNITHGQKMILLAPCTEIFEQAKKINKKFNLDIPLLEVNDLSLDKIVHEIKDKNIQAIVARGGLAIKLRERISDISIIEIPVTGFDIIESIYEARKISNKIAIIGFSNVIHGIPKIEKILGIQNSLVYLRDNLNDCRKLVLNAISNKVKVIVGDSKSVKIAKEYNIPGILINTREESIITAYEEADRLIEFIKEKTIRIKKTEAILNNIETGIIALDQNQIVTNINPQAQKILKTSNIMALGYNIKNLNIDNNFINFLEKRNEDYGVIVNLNNNRVVMNKVPVITNDGEISGTIITLDEIGRVQKVEEKIRKQLYLKGHVAKNSFKDIIASSKVMQQTIDKAKSYSEVDSVILIIGETGVGKEVFAQSIHNASARAEGPFVAINCAALPASILESELFGYVKGAFTDARKEGKMGIFEQAHQGTILLDEITEMPLDLQARLLRVLQEKEILRLGDDKIIKVNCRIIATTNGDIESLVEAGKFRSDLFYRLNVLNLNIPPLRIRENDIKLLAEYFLYKFSKTYHKPIWDIDNEAIKILKKHNWPGNVRELSAIIERVVVQVKRNKIIKEDFDFLNDKKSHKPATTDIKNHTMKVIYQALKECGGNQTLAAKMLGIDRSTLWRKLKIHENHND